MSLDIESTPLEIKTASASGSEDKLLLFFYNTEGEYAGGLKIYFSSTPQYQIDGCSASSTRSDFSTSLSTAASKVWRVALSRTSEEIRLEVHCNEVLVLSTLISGTTCAKSDWATPWNRDVEKIKFGNWDSASDLYRPYLQGRNLTCLSLIVMCFFDIHVGTIVSGSADIKSRRY